MSPRTFGIFLFVFGIISIFFPRVIFFFQEGWKFQDAEPSDLFIFMTRAAGVAAIVFSLFGMFGRFEPVSKPDQSAAPKSSLEPKPSSSGQ
jgi:hypothetical protein